jgi:hypothetical protein
MHMIVMFVIYAAGDLLLEWRWPVSARPVSARAVTGEDQDQVD